MARDGKIAVWEGIWLSSAVLLPLGVFFTYKAVGDSAVFNFDAYNAFFRRLAGKETPRALAVKEVRMEETEPAEALRLLGEFSALTEDARRHIAALPRPLRRLRGGRWTARLREPLNELVEYISNSGDRRVIGLLNQYPFTPRVRTLDAIAETTRRLTDLYNTENPDSTAYDKA